MNLDFDNSEIEINNDNVIKHKKDQKKLLDDENEKMNNVFQEKLKTFGALKTIEISNNKKFKLPFIKND